MKRAYLTLLAVALLCVPALSQTPQKIANINRKVVGKWVSADKKSYIEFLANGSCADGELFPDGKWHVNQNTLGAWEQGEDFSCGSGDLTLISPNMLVRDYGMGGRPEKFYRGAGNMPKPVGSLTMPIAQRVLNEQINQTMVNNTLLTCHACYDPSDKEDTRAFLATERPSPFPHIHLAEPNLTLVSPDARSRCRDSLIFSINIHSAVCTNGEFGSEYSVSFDTETGVLERHNHTEI